MKLEDPPKYRINEAVRVFGYKCSIISCLWRDGSGWIYEIFLTRGNKKGSWMVRESEVDND